MQSMLILSALVAVSVAIVCPPDFCDNVKQEALNCKGGVRKNTGFCGCTDSCAKVEGELCRPEFNLFGVPNEEVCDEGLTCEKVYLENSYNAVCVDKSKNRGGMLTSRKKRSNMMVCPENACANVKKPVMNCANGIIENGGFCGCTDVCALGEGDLCEPMNVFLLFSSTASNAPRCGPGLECKTRNLEGHTYSSCVDPSKIKDDGMLMSKRSAPSCDTPCRRKSLSCTFSMVVWKGQWFSKCDLEGNFLPQQCNNIHECFCVDQDGVIDESTRVLGSANC